MMVNDEEIKLISQCLAGDVRSYELLVRRYQSCLYHLAYRMTGCRESALDLTQEVFLTAYKKLDRFDRAKSFRNWLMKICSNLCLDQLRRERFWGRLLRERSGCLGAWGANQVMPETGPEYRPVFFHLKRLTDKERMILLLKVLEEWDVTQIADALGCREGTVRVHLFNARNKMKRALTEEGVNRRSQ